MPLREVAASVGLAKSTTHGIITTLIDDGLARQDRTTGKYLLGEVVSRRALRPGGSVVRAAALKWCDALAARFGVSMMATVQLGLRVVTVYGVAKPGVGGEPSVGREISLHASAAGKIHLAFSTDLLHAVPRELPSFTSRTLARRVDLVDQLDAARRLGWAISDQERRWGVTALAVPVWWRNSEFLCSLSAESADQPMITGGSPNQALLSAMKAAAADVATSMDDY
ncbi:IclR family transcriptional regulator [Pseudonocardia sulfidoxydans]